MKIFRLLRRSSLPPLLRRLLLPPPLRRLLSPVPRFLSFHPFRATSTTSISIITLRRLKFQRGTSTRLFSLSPLTTVTLSPYTTAPILRPSKFLILRQLFTHFPISLLPSFDGDRSFSVLPQPPLLLPPLGRRRPPSRRLRFSFILLWGLPREALLGDMTLPLLRLRPGRLLSLPHLRLRPGRLLSLRPVVPILTDSTVPLLSSEWGVLGEWGVWGVQGL